MMPVWVVYVLKFSAIYNIAWGLSLVLIPQAPFRWQGLEVPNYPIFLQCLGVVLGVYGVGYWIAAADAVTHWPIVFVGLLGKVIWPIVFAISALQGEAPRNMYLPILVNDVAWWLPFTAILLHAARIHEARRMTSDGVTLEQALREAVVTNGQNPSDQNLFDLSFQSPLLLICVRHLGCTFCREALSDLSHQRQDIERATLIPIVIHMASTEQMSRMMAQYGLHEVKQVSDPGRHLFRALELPFGTLRQLLSWTTIWRAVGEGTVFRFGFGPFVGNGLQLSGTFVVKDGRIVRAVRHDNAAQRTDFAKLSCEIAS